MQKLHLILSIALGASLAAIVAMQVHTAKAEPLGTNERDSLMLTRACAYAGAATEVDCSAAAAYSSQLNANSRYIIQALGGALYFRQGTAGSGQDAAASTSIAIPPYAAIDIYTRAGRYFSCDGSATGGKAYYIECQ